MRRCVGAHLHACTSPLSHTHAPSSVQVVRAPGVWGEDILLQNGALQQNFAALAVSYLWLYSLDSDSLGTAMRDLPHTAQGLEKLRLRWACRRSLVAAAERSMIAEGKHFLGRLYPLYGHQGQAALSLAKQSTRRSSAVAEGEWWNDDNAARNLATEPTDDAARSSPSTPALISSVYRSVLRGSTKVGAGAPGQQSNEKTIEAAARLFGAQKMKQNNMYSSTREALERLTSDVSRIDERLNTLAEGMEAIMGALQVERPRAPTYEPHHSPASLKSAAQQLPRPMAADAKQASSKPDGEPANAEKVEGGFSMFWA